MEHPGLPRLDEATHQALDQLDDAPHEASPAELEMARAALDELSETLWRHARSALLEFAPKAPASDALSPSQLDAALAEFDAAPSRALGLTTLRELAAEAWGVEPGGGLDGWLKAEAEAMALSTPAFALDRALAAWVRSAYPSPRSEVSPAARRLRCELVRPFHPRVRAAALAAEQPDQVGFALELVAKHPDDVAAQIDAFALARAEAESKGLAPGPPRRFSWYHVAFAILIAGLSAYHYLWR